MARSLPNGFLDDDPPPSAFLFLRQPGFAQPFDNRAEQLRGDGQIKQHIAAGVELVLHGLKQIGETRIGFGVGEIAGKMGNAAGDKIPGFLVERLGLAA